MKAWNAETLRQRREKANLRQQDVADKVGVTKMAVSLWESGTNMPTADKLAVLAELFKCRVDDFYRPTIVSTKVSETVSRQSHETYH